MSFGENLQKLRKGKNISQENLAEELKVSRQTIGKWENGTTYSRRVRFISSPS